MKCYKFVQYRDNGDLELKEHMGRFVESSTLPTCNKNEKLFLNTQKSITVKDERFSWSGIRKYPGRKWRAGDSKGYLQLPPKLPSSIYERDRSITMEIGEVSAGFNELCLTDSLSNRIMVIWKRHGTLFMQGVHEWFPLYFLCFAVVIRFTTWSVINHIW